MKKSLVIVAVLAALGGMGVFAGRVSAQINNTGSGVVPAAGSQAATLKIGVVNMVKVLKSFDKANYLGEMLIKQAQDEETKLKAEDQTLKALEQKLQAMPTGPQRDAAEKDFQDKKFRFSQVMMDYRKKYQEKQGEMAVEVWDNIERVIDVIAKTRSLELVLTYPDAIDEKTKKQPATAFQKLAPSGANVAWSHPGLDITDHVIATLNHNFKPPAGTVPPSNRAPGSGTNP